jgi:hypothetical protein
MGFLSLSALAQKVLLKKLINVRNIFWLIICMISSFFLVKRFTFVHPFILSDNRHYVFYIWKRFFERMPHFRYYLCLPYAISLLTINEILSKCSKYDYVLLLNFSLLHRHQKINNMEINFLVMFFLDSYTFSAHRSTLFYNSNDYSVARK